MAAVPPDAGSLSGVGVTDIIDLERGSGAALKRVTVEELLRGVPSVVPTVPVWDDLRFPAQAINPVGALAPPAVDETETGFPGCFLFSGSQDQMISGFGQLPHSWDRSVVRPHIHWAKPTGSSNAVAWELRIRVVGNPGDVAGAWSDAITGTLVAGDQTVSDNHLLTSFGDVDLGDKIESAIFAWRLYRRGSSDAENNAVRLYEFDVHFRISQLGTIPEIPS